MLNKKINKKGVVKLSTSIVNNLIIGLLLILVVAVVIRYIYIFSSEKTDDAVCITAIQYSNRQGVPLDTSKCPSLQFNANSESDVANVLIRCNVRLNDMSPEKILQNNLDARNNYNNNKKILLYECGELELKRNIKLLEYLSKNQYKEGLDYLTYFSNSDISKKNENNLKCTKLDVDDEYISKQELKSGKYIIYAVFPSTLNAITEYENNQKDWGRTIRNTLYIGVGTIVTVKLGLFAGTITGVILTADYVTEQVIKQFIDPKYESELTTYFYNGVKKFENVFKLSQPEGNYNINLNKICTNVFTTTIDEQENIGEKYLFMKSSQTLSQDQIDATKTETLDEFKQGLIIVKYDPQYKDQMFNTNNVYIYHPKEMK